MPRADTLGGNGRPFTEGSRERRIRIVEGGARARHGSRAHGETTNRRTGRVKAKVADGFDECLSAANTVSAVNNEEAYGILCSPYISPPIIMAEESAKVTIATAAKLLRRLAHAVDAIADDYEGTDRDNANDVDDIEMEPPPFNDPGIQANPPGTSDGTVTA